MNFFTTTIDILKGSFDGFKTDIEFIRKGMNHIMEIITLQQKYAGLRGMETSVNINDLIRDAAENNT